jgi:hypothetical protein
MKKTGLGAKTGQRDIKNFYNLLDYKKPVPPYTTLSFHATQSGQSFQPIGVCVCIHPFRVTHTHTGFHGMW